MQTAPRAGRGGGGLQHTDVDSGLYGSLEGGIVVGDGGRIRTGRVGRSVETDRFREALAVALVVALARPVFERCDRIVSEIRTGPDRGEGRDERRKESRS